jgi:hypothetical protein
MPYSKRFSPRCRLASNPQTISYHEVSVPVAQLNVSSETPSVQPLFDYAFNFLRLQLFMFPGFSSPAPLGGLQRGVMLNIDPSVVRGQCLGQRLAR